MRHIGIGLVALALVWSVPGCGPSGSGGSGGYSSDGSGGCCGKPGACSIPACSISCPAGYYSDCHEDKFICPDKGSIPCLKNDYCKCRECKC
jgi:hypothetical protein